MHGEIHYVRLTSKDPLGETDYEAQYKRLTMRPTMRPTMRDPLGETRCERPTCTGALSPSILPFFVPLSLIVLHLLSTLRK